MSSFPENLSDFMTENKTAQIKTGRKNGKAIVKEKKVPNRKYKDCD